MSATVGRPLPQILGELIGLGEAVIGNTASAPNFLPRLLELQAEFSAWKGVSRFAEWILLGALISIASAEAETMADLQRYLRIAQDGVALTIGRRNRLMRHAARPT